MIVKPEKTEPMKVKCITVLDDHIPEFYRTHECGTSSIREALVPEMAYWRAYNPVLIDAPTGKGKTTFVYLDVIPLAKAQNKNVLIVSNRIALSIQQKLEIMKSSDSPMIDRLTDKGIRETENFGLVSVTTYHSLPAFVKNPDNQKWLKNVGFVVADEAHFFVADSSFNENCGYYLDLITKKFRDAIRIYMTATSWDVLYPLAEAEKRNNPDRQAYFRPWDISRSFHRYVFPADYRHVDLHFFDDLNEILEKIQADDPTGKWVIFVDDKRKGEELAEKLENEAVYIDANSKDTDEWRELLQKSRFEKKVLIATKVLDCGVNFIDTNLHNIVVVTDDRTSLIQMLGRKRFVPGERVNLFVCDISKQKIGRRYKDLLVLNQWYERYKVGTWGIAPEDGK